MGDQVALVLADTEQIAAEACKKIIVDYEDLPVVDSPEASMENAVLLHQIMGQMSFSNIKFYGDVESAFGDCDVIVECEYRANAGACTCGLKPRSIISTMRAGHGCCSRSVDA